MQETLLTAYRLRQKPHMPPEGKSFRDEDWFHKTLAENVWRAFRRSAGLSYKQWQVLHLIAAEGLEDKEISDKLGIKEEAVKKRLDQIMKKASLNRRALLVRWYFGL